MQHTIGGLADHIVNKEIHHWLALSATSLTALSHTSRQMQIGGQTQTHNNWAADNGGWPRHTKPAGLFWGWESCVTLTAGEGFVRPISTVSPSITVPVGGDAAAAGAAELSLGTCGCSYVEDEDDVSFLFSLLGVFTCWWGGEANINLYLTNDLLTFGGLKDCFGRMSRLLPRIPDLKYFIYSKHWRLNSKLWNTHYVRCWTFWFDL